MSEQQPVGDLRRRLRQNVRTRRQEETLQTTPTKCCPVFYRRLSRRFKVQPLLEGPNFHKKSRFEKMQEHFRTLFFVKQLLPWVHWHHTFVHPACTLVHPTLVCAYVGSDKFIHHVGRPTLVVTWFGLRWNTGYTLCWLQLVRPTLVLSTIIFG